MTPAETVEAYFTGMARGDRDLWMSIWAPDALWYDPPSPNKPPLTGVAAMAEHWEKTFRRLRSLEYERHRTWVCGQEAAASLTVTCRGRHGGIATIDDVNVWEFDDQGRLSVMKSFWTMADVTFVEPFPDHSWPVDPNLVGAAAR